MNPGGVVPAAGLSRRMGTFKPLLDLQGKPLIARTLDSLISAGIERIVVVTGYEAETLEKVIHDLYKERVETVYNPRYRESDMLESLRIGLSRLPEKGAFFVLPGDMPAVSSQTFALLKEALETSGKEAVFPLYQGHRGHPPLIHGELIPKIITYRGEGGLGGFLSTRDTLEVETGDKGCLLDGDTPEDLNLLRDYLRL